MIKAREALSRLRSDALFDGEEEAVNHDAATLSAALDELDRLRRERDRLLEHVKQAVTLLDQEWNSDAMEYGTQGVNQAHRHLAALLARVEEE